MAVRGAVRGDFQRERMKWAFVFILMGYLTLMGRLLYLQSVQGAALRSEALARREMHIPQHARKGSLCDRDGRPLAVSLYSGTVGFDPKCYLPVTGDAKAVQKQTEEKAAAISQAAALLNLPPDALARQIEAARVAYNPLKPCRWVVVKKDVPLEVASALRDARPKLLGFGINDDSKRVYAIGRDAAQIVGFVQSDNRGANGLERGCRKWLDGQDGKAVAEVDSQKREIPDTLQQIEPTRNGLDVHTTLDANIQHIATEEAQRIQDKYHPVGVSVVIVQPDTGDILALVSTPGYDPAPASRKNLTPEQFAASQWERCAGRLYEPGSTLKAMTIASALDAGTITPQSGFECDGEIHIGNKIIHCDSHNGSSHHGWVMAGDILRVSCNVGAVQIGLKMGPKALFAAEEKFGLLDALDIGLPGEKRGRLTFGTKEKIYTAAKAARVSFGMSIATTPLHVAMAYAAIANDGILMKPRLIASTTDASGLVKEKFDPHVERRVIKPETARLVRSMLRTVVSSGTAKVTALPGYMIAGKTGTARKYNRLQYVGSFVGFLPASPNAKPRAVVLVAVDEPQGQYYGSDVAAPAFQSIARRLMAYWRVPQDDPNSTQARTAEETLRKAGFAPAHPLPPIGARTIFN